MKNKLPLPPGVAYQVELFRLDDSNSHKENEAIVKRYLNLILSDGYRASSTVRLENRTVLNPRKNVRIRKQKK